MNAFKVTSSLAIQPDTCPAQVDSFLRTSAQYLGLTLDFNRMETERQCLTATPALQVTGWCDQYAPNQHLENRL